MASSPTSSQTIGLSIPQFRPLGDRNNFFFLSPTTAPLSFGGFITALGFFLVVVVFSAVAVVVLSIAVVVFVGFFSKSDEGKERGERDAKELQDSLSVSDEFWHIG